MINMNRINDIAPHIIRGYDLTRDSSRNARRDAVMLYCDDPAIDDRDMRRILNRIDLILDDA